MNLSTLKDNIRALKEKLEKMFERGEHGVATVVGEITGELHTLINDFHGIVEGLEERIAKLEARGTAAVDRLRGPDELYPAASSVGNATGSLSSVAGAGSQVRELTAEEEERQRKMADANMQGDAAGRQQQQ